MLIDSIELIGKSTQESIMSGVINGTIAEISSIIERYQNISDNFALVFCGGDGVFLSSNTDYQSVYEKNILRIRKSENIGKTYRFHYKGTSKAITIK